MREVAYNKATTAVIAIATYARTARSIPARKKNSGIITDMVSARATMMAGEAAGSSSSVATRATKSSIRRAHTLRAVPVRVIRSEV